MNRVMAKAAAGIAALGLIAGTAGACSSTSSNTATPPASTTTATATAAQTQGNATQAPKTTTSLTAGEKSVADVVKQADPSVVRIQSSSGVGTGIIVSSDGDIMTNAHVVTGRNQRLDPQVTVTLSDGTELTARVVGGDARIDLALLDIDGSGYTPMKLASSADTYVGQNVVAIGYALDLSGGEGAGYTVTTGIVSAKNRGTSETSSTFGAIQTDAAINPGNSGGPLLNLLGEVVGVNTSLAPNPETGGTALGIGFAIESDVIKAVYDSLKATGKVNRGYLGIADFRSLLPAKAKALGLPTDQGGVYLNADSVSANSPAARAGLQPNDVIAKLGDTTIKTETDLAIALIKNQAGQTVPMQIFRGGKQVTLQVTLGSPTTP